MTRLRSMARSVASAPGRMFAAIAGGIRAVVDPLRPEEGTTEGALYIGLILLAAGFVVRGQPELALMIPGIVIAFLASAPVLVGILRKGA